jgi:hypothetical protein
MIDPIEMAILNEITKAIKEEAMKQLGPCPLCPPLLCLGLGNHVEKCGVPEWNRKIINRVRWVIETIIGVALGGRKA